ncbi:hypothetical protein AB0E56_01650 [Microbacterium sp. NPDC028030]|uniref:hypothetical protein n=1 Tax=Microbacterium sp. NPDC028030 TaxID=3155124 RepID=UPI0034110C2D
MKNRNAVAALALAAIFGMSALTGATSASADTTSPAAAGTRAVGASTTAVDAAAQTDSNSPDCIVCGVPVKKAVKLSGPVLISKKFVRYLTGAWARSTGYAWSSSTTVSASIDSSVGMSAAGASSNIGVSASVTKSYSITVNIAASSTRYSKLGLASNFNRYYVKSAYFQDGKQLAGSSWSYGYLYAPTKDQFLIVYYQ